MTQPEAFDGMSRDELITRARALGAQRPELMTRVELCDEVVRLSEPDESRRKTSRGWLGVARDLVASVVEAGLNMRDAAAVIRGEARLETDPLARAPVATVTLAEIYAAQGHADRALAIIAQVLESEPDHAAALALRDKLERDKPTASDKRQPRTREPEPQASVEAPPPEAAPEPATSEAPEHTESTAPPTDVVSPPVVASAPDGTVQRSILVLWEHAADAHLTWRMAPDVFARLEREDPDGALVIRLVAYVPRPEGATRMSRDVAARSLSGSAAVRGFGPRAVLRAALGWSSSRGFIPVAVAAHVDPRSRDEIKLLYTPPAGLDPRTLAIAREALEALDAA